MPGHSTPHRRSFLDVLLAPILILIMVAAACSSSPAEVATNEPTSGAPESTTMPPPAPSSSSTTAVASSEPDSPTTVDLEIDSDGWFPWIFPSPTLSWYEEGCSSPEDVARNFMSNFFDEPDPVLSSLSASDHPDRRRYLVHNRGEGGASLDSGTVLDFARVDLEIVDCDAWVIVSAASEFVTLDDVEFTADQRGTVVLVSGEGTGFEATIDLRAHDESFRTVAEGFAMGGGFEPAPFDDGVMNFLDVPIDPNLIIIGSSSNPADGATPQFAAIKARCCGGETVAVRSQAGSETFLAVVGVAANDVLNVRSGPGVDSAIVGELSPFAVGARLLADEPVAVGADVWVRIASPDREGGWNRGWVNQRFVAQVASTDAPSPEVLDAAYDIREALSSNASVERLADLMTDRGGDTIVVSSDAFIADDDQRLTAEDLDLAGTPGDLVRQWGVTDGEGSPIVATIEEYFSAYADSPALAGTDVVAVDQRVRSSNTIDNLLDVFPTATVIEFHHDGGTGDAADFEWSTVRLAFEPSATGPRLVAIVTDNWTI